MYIIARMLLGVGILFCIISGAALIGELGHPKERAVLTSLFNSSYFIGQILASAIAIGTTEIPSNWAWRLPSLLQICPSLLQIATVLYVQLIAEPVNDRSVCRALLTTVPACCPSLLVTSFPTTGTTRPLLS